MSSGTMDLETWVLSPRQSPICPNASILHKLCFFLEVEMYGIGGYLTTMVFFPTKRNSELWILQGSLNREGSM